MAAAVVAACILLVEIWLGRGDEYVFSLFVSGCVYVAWANLLLCLPVKPAHRWLRLATLAAGAATVMLTELIVFDFKSEVVQRLDAATAILAGCGTLGLGVLAMLSRPVDFESLPGEFLKITVVCPACRKKQAIELGGASCKDCGLRIEVRTAEPRCAECGYLLYRLTSDNCPECGTPIRREAAATSVAHASP